MRNSQVYGIEYSFIDVKNDGGDGAFLYHNTMKNQISDLISVTSTYHHNIYCFKNIKITLYS